MTEQSATVVRIHLQISYLDGAAAEQLLRDGQAAISAGAEALVIDLASVERLDSQGISALLSLRRRAPARLRIVLASLSPSAHKIALATHLQEIFDIYADARTAVEDVSS